MTFKEWLSRWYHSPLVAKTAVAAFLKFGLQMAFWGLVLTGVMAIATFVPVPIVPEFQLFDDRFNTALGSLVLMFAAGEYCMFTLPASEIELQQQD